MSGIEKHIFLILRKKNTQIFFRYLYNNFENLHRIYHYSALLCLKYDLRVICNEVNTLTRKFESARLRS
jgi:hypothetical protein